MPAAPSRLSNAVKYTAAEGLRVRVMDEDAVVFESVSWEAHLLNPAAHAVLEWLGEAARTETEVVEFLHDALEPSEQAQAADHARRLLGELQSLGLVHRLEDRREDR